MFVVTVIVSVLLALALLGSAAGKLTKNPKIVENMTKLNVPATLVPKLAVLEIAGAVGLLVGLAVPALGAAAAIGVILYFVGAITYHVRAHDKELAAPAVLMLVAVAALVLRLATA
jgi:uncharacterized membrane protein YphA (DoxX/SURF4 family)